MDLSPTEAVAGGYTFKEARMHEQAAEAERSEHPWCQKRGLSAKVAAKFEAPIKNFAKNHEKNPLLQKFANTVSKCAHGGRLPLTEESTAILKLTCDKKYYSDMRNPSLSEEEKERITQNYHSARDNILLLAERDGVNLAEANRKFSKKVAAQAKIDPDIKVIYPNYKNGTELLMSEPAAPKSIEEHMNAYRDKMIAFDKDCKTPVDYRRNHRRPEFAELKEIVLNSARADNPDSLDELIYMFDRANIEITNARLEKQSKQINGIKQPLMAVPLSWSELEPPEPLDATPPEPPQPPAGEFNVADTLDRINKAVDETTKDLLAKNQATIDSVQGNPASVQSNSTELDVEAAKVDTDKPEPAPADAKPKTEPQGDVNAAEQDVENRTVENALETQDVGGYEAAQAEAAKIREEEENRSKTGFETKLEEMDEKLNAVAEESVLEGDAQDEAVTITSEPEYADDIDSAEFDEEEVATLDTDISKEIDAEDESFAKTVTDAKQPELTEDQAMATEDAIAEELESAQDDAALKREELINVLLEGASDANNLREELRDRFEAMTDEELEGYTLNLSREIVAECLSQRTRDLAQWTIREYMLDTCADLEGCDTKKAKSAYHDSCAGLDMDEIVEKLEELAPGELEIHLSNAVTKARDELGLETNPEIPLVSPYEVDTPEDLDVRDDEPATVAQREKLVASGLSSEEEANSERKTAGEARRELSVIADGDTLSESDVLKDESGRTRNSPYDAAQKTNEYHNEIRKQAEAKGLDFMAKEGREAAKESYFEGKPEKRKDYEDAKSDKAFHEKKNREARQNPESASAGHKPKSLSDMYFAFLQAKAPAGSALAGAKDVNDANRNAFDNAITRDKVNSSKHNVDAQKRNLSKAERDKELQNLQVLKDFAFPEDKSSRPGMDAWARIANAMAGTDEPKLLDVCRANLQAQNNIRVCKGSLADAKKVYQETISLAGYTYLDAKIYNILRPKGQSASVQQGQQPQSHVPQQGSGATNQTKPESTPVEKLDMKKLLEDEEKVGKTSAQSGDDKPGKLDVSDLYQKSLRSYSEINPEDVGVQGSDKESMDKRNEEIKAKDRANDAAQAAQAEQHSEAQGSESPDTPSVQGSDKEAMDKRNEEIKAKDRANDAAQAAQAEQHSGDTEALESKSGDEDKRADTEDKYPKVRFVESQVDVSESSNDAKAMNERNEEAKAQEKANDAAQAVQAEHFEQSAQSENSDKPVSEELKHRNEDAVQKERADNAAQNAQQAMSDEKTKVDKDGNGIDDNVEQGVAAHKAVAETVTSNSPPKANYPGVNHVYDSNANGLPDHTENNAGRYDASTSTTLDVQSSQHDSSDHDYGD